MDDATLRKRLDEWYDLGTFATAEALALSWALAPTAAPSTEPTLTEFPRDLLDAVRERTQAEGPARSAALALLTTLDAVHEREDGWTEGHVLPESMRFVSGARRWHLRRLVGGTWHVITADGTLYPGHWPDVPCKSVEDAMQYSEQQRWRLNGHEG
jgi:hypothetical protein